MIDVILGRFKDQYNMKFNPKTKILSIYTPMLVKDYVHLKRLIKIHKIEVKDIRVIGRNK